MTLADFHLGSIASAVVHHRILDYPSGMPSRSRGRSGGNPTTPTTRAPSSTTPSSAQSVALGSRLDKSTSLKSSLVIGTADGGLGMLVPVDERIHRRLALLQQIMSTSVPTTCCLNASEYRATKTCRNYTVRKGGVLDGNLLWRYVSLEEGLQDELAAVMGTTADAIIENLQELDNVNSFF